MHVIGCEEAFQQIILQDERNVTNVVDHHLKELVTHHLLPEVLIIIYILIYHPSIIYFID